MMNPEIQQHSPGQEVWALVRVERSEIFYLRYTLEAYEGLCVSTTQPGGDGLVLIYTGAGQRETLERLLNALPDEMQIELVKWGEGIYEPE